MKRICHTNDDGIDIELTLIKDNKTINLNGQEFRELLSFIGQSLPALESGMMRYYPIPADRKLSTKDVQLLIEKVPSLASLIIEHGLDKGDLLKSLMLKKRMQDLEEMKAMIADDPDENVWQSWFQERPWLFGSQAVDILDNRIVDEKTKVDYLYRDLGTYVSIIEIKKAGVVLFKEDRSHNIWCPKDELSNAIIQCANYIYRVEKKDDSRDFYDKIHCSVLKPKCTLIIGKSSDWDDDRGVCGRRADALRILNDSLHGIEIITYDQLLKRASLFLNRFSDNPEVLFHRVVSNDYYVYIKSMMYYVLISKFKYSI